jgi:hypothetical protein
MKPLCRAFFLPVLCAFFGCGGGDSPKLPAAGFKVEFGKHNIPTEMVEGETVLADVTIKNASSSTWPGHLDSRARNAVNLSYHWLDRKRQVVVFEGFRTPLPRDLNPGESVTLRSAIRAPEKAGKHVLQVTLVQGSPGFQKEMGVNFQFRSQSWRDPRRSRKVQAIVVGRQDEILGSSQGLNLLNDCPGVVPTSFPVPVSQNTVTWVRSILFLFDF